MPEKLGVLGMAMNRRQKLCISVLAIGVAIAYTVAYLGCHMASLDIAKCADPLNEFSYYAFVPASLVSAACVLFQFYKKHRPDKTHLAATCVVIIITVMLVIVTSVVTEAYDMSIFCLTLVVIWLSLLADNRFVRAIVGWPAFALFLALVMVFVFPDYPVVISLLYALFSGGAALYQTGARKLAELGCYVVAGSIVVLIAIMGGIAVAEMGMPGEGYEILILYEGMDRATPYADGIMVVAAGFFGLSPLIYLATKDPEDRP